MPEEPDWYVQNRISPEQYLNTRVFDNPLHGEQAIGLRILLPQLERHSLWEYLHDRCQSGDFCVIFVRRNPVCCFVSALQASQTRIWSCPVSSKVQLVRPAPVDVDPTELTKFCRDYAANEARLRQVCDDRLEIEFLEMIIDYHQVMAGVFDFLHVPRFADVCSGVRRLKNNAMRDRVRNFDVLARQVPYDVKQYLDDELLI